MEIDLDRVERECREFMSVTPSKKEFLTLIDRLRSYEKELDEIKKQEPAETAYAMPGASGFTISVFWSEKVPAGSPVYAKPVYQHSFTVDGHTFYADNEVDILYLERKFGVGGKAKLEVVKDD